MPCHSLKRDSLWQEEELQGSSCKTPVEKWPEVAAHVGAMLQGGPQLPILPGVHTLAGLRDSPRIQLDRWLWQCVTSKTSHSRNYNSLLGPLEMLSLWETSRHVLMMFKQCCGGAHVDGSWGLFIQSALPMLSSISQFSLLMLGLAVPFSISEGVDKTHWWVDPGSVTYNCHKCRCHSELSERRMVQISLLPSITFYTHLA